MLGGFLVDLEWIWGRFGVDLGSIWGRFSVLGGSWGGPGWVLGGLGVAMGAQDRFLIDFGSILKPILGSKTDQNRSKIDAKMDQFLNPSWDRIFEGFWWIFEVKMEPSWHPKTVKSRNRRYSGKTN